MRHIKAYLDRALTCGGSGSNSGSDDDAYESILTSTVAWRVVPLQCWPTGGWRCVAVCQVCQPAEDGGGGRVFRVFAVYSWHRPLAGPTAR